MVDYVDNDFFGAGFDISSHVERANAVDIVFGDVGFGNYSPCFFVAFSHVFEEVERR